MLLESETRVTAMASSMRVYKANRSVLHYYDFLSFSFHKIPFILIFQFRPLLFTLVTKLGFTGTGSLSHPLASCYLNLPPLI
jgi:hypothetical protein